VRTGGRELAEAGAGFGGAIANLGVKYYNIQATTQSSQAERLAVEEMNRLSLSFEGNLDPETYLKEYEKSLKTIQSSTGAILTNKKAVVNFGLFLNSRQPRWENSVKDAQKARVVDNWMAELFDKKAGIEQSGIYGDFSKFIAKGVSEGMMDKSDGVRTIIQTKTNAEKGIINQFIRAGNIDSAFEAIKSAKMLTPQEKTSLENSVTNRALQLRNLSNEAFDDRAGQATEKWFKSLEEGTLTDNEIITTDLQAVGEQKTSEVTLKRQWQKILRDTIKLTEPLVSNESVYDSLVVGSEQVERGTKSPAEWDLEYAQAWANGDLEKEDRRGLRVKDIVATKTMQNRAFSEGTINNLSRLVELRDDELSGMVAQRDAAFKAEDYKTVNTLNFSIKKAQIQKWNYGRFRTDLRQTYR
jgi:succinate dehydrogenase flavin-adding protein (antitoxin of CptAB toxin-antitoxin module)